MRLKSGARALGTLLREAGTDGECLDGVGNNAERENSLPPTFGLILEVLFDVLARAVSGRHVAGGHGGRGRVPLPAVGGVDAQVEAPSDHQLHPPLAVSREKGFRLFRLRTEQQQFG